MTLAAYSFARNKLDGTATVTIFGGRITFQRADTLGRNAFHVPAKLVSKEKLDDREVRHYAVSGWTVPLEV